jgi:hypothetical protein
MAVACLKCSELNIESAFFCTHCGHKLSKVVVPVGIQLVSYFYIYSALKMAVIIPFCWGIFNQIGDIYISRAYFLVHSIVACSIALYLGFNLKKLKRIALYIFYVSFTLGIIASELIFGKLYPFLQKYFLLNGLRIGHNEQSLVELFMVSAFSVGLIFNMVLFGYVFTQRKLFTK